MQKERRQDQDELVITFLFWETETRRSEEEGTQLLNTEITVIGGAAQGDLPTGAQ